tara:strand:+ start:264 stop:425 length:162 start_codon:yes stop_codon:yes gene_type:complete
MEKIAQVWFKAKMAWSGVKHWFFEEAGAEMVAISVVVFIFCLGIGYAIAACVS